MLVLCYGLTKSGSTLAFELVRGILNEAGHRQDRLPDGVVNAGHRINYVQPLNRKKLDELLSEIGSRWIAVKTHAGLSDPLFAYIEKLQHQKRLQLTVSYRDPRDICLSMVDAGRKARASGYKEFSEITDIEIASERLSEQLEKLFKWAAVPGTLLLDYNMVAFDPDDAIERMEHCLGIRTDHEIVKKYVFEEAFTQKNKAERNRYLRELSREQVLALSDKFRPFISNFIEGNPAHFLSETRLQVAARETLRLSANGPQKPGPKSA